MANYIFLDPKGGGSFEIPRLEQSALKSNKRKFIVLALILYPREMQLAVRLLSSRVLTTDN